MKGEDTQVFYIDVPELHWQTVTIKATSVEEALEAVRRGEGAYHSGTDYDSTLGPDERFPLYAWIGTNDARAYILNEDLEWVERDKYG